LPTSLGSRAVGLVGTLLLARYLAPAEYGEVSAASILVTTASTMTAFGVGIYLVMNPTISRAETFHATCCFLVTGLVGLGIVWALCGPLGAWSGAPGLGRFMPLLVLCGLLDRVAYIPERVLIRRLRFRRLSLARAFGELAYTGASLALAALGAGAMAIVWGNLARSALRFAAIVLAVERREWLEPHRVRLATTLKIIRFGFNVSVTSIASFAMRRWDNLLVGRYFGPAAMGAYNYAYNLADTPAVAIGEQMSDVICASFPHIAGEKRAAALVRSLTMNSLVMLPLAFGLGAVGETVVQAFFDEKWSSVGTMLVFLSVVSAARPMTSMLHAYLYACERPSIVLALEWLSLAALVAAIPTVGRIGIGWTCGAVGAVFVLRTLASLWVVSRLDAVPLSSFLLPLARPLVACAAMVAAIVAVRPALHGSPATRLAIEVGLGAAVYLAGAFLIFRTAAREFVGLVRSALS
jgi:PST family polysaccharide transporter